MTDDKQNGKTGMIVALQKYLAGIPPIFLDGCIAVGIAMLTALSMSFATDDSAKYVDPALRFWMIVFIGSTTQGLHALSKFRDRSYSNHVEEQKNGGNGKHNQATTPP